MTHCCLHSFWLSIACVKWHMLLLATCLLLWPSLANCAAINRTFHVSGPKGDDGILQLPIGPGHAFSDRDHPVNVVRKGSPLDPDNPHGFSEKDHPGFFRKGLPLGQADHPPGERDKGYQVKGDVKGAKFPHKGENLLPPLVGAVHGVGNVGSETEKPHQGAKLPDQNADVIPLPVREASHRGQEELRFVPKEGEVPKPLPPHIVPMKLDEVQPPDHVDGLRVEHDGHLNREYKKEVLIGNHEEFERGGEKRLLSRLKIVFMRADKNHDSLLTHAELKSWIMFKVQEHLDEAALENERIFRHLDTDGDGFVTWKEFHVHFLLAKGHAQNETLQHVEDYDTLSMDSEDRERLIRYKFRWAEADEEPQDNRLTIKEMRNFRHPEQSPKMIIRMAKDLVDNLDRDEDGIVTEEEFAALPPGDTDDMMREDTADQTWKKERIKEYRGVIDLNHDGKVDIEELKIYVDPHNENHAHLEADNLIQLADLNNDGKLSMSEVLDNAELFLGSKMVDTGQNFHDEF